MCCSRGVGAGGRKVRACQDCQEYTSFCGDMYARKVDLVLPTGQTHYKTCAGGCVSALVILATLIFLLSQISVLMDDNSFQLQRAVAKDWYLEDEMFPENPLDGDILQIAFGVVDSQKKQIQKEIDPSYGRLTAKFQTRKNDQNGEVTDSVSDELEIRPCFREEIGLELFGGAIADGGSRFYPFDSITTEQLVFKHSEGLFCIRNDFPEDVQGDEQDSQNDNAVDQADQETAQTEESQDENSEQKSDEDAAVTDQEDASNDTTEDT